MKKISFICAAVALFLSLAAFTSPEIPASTNPVTTDLDCEEDRFFADLIIRSYTTNIGPMTTRCGGDLPNISCCGGQRGFMATIRIQNIGNLGIAPGRFKVLWRDLSNGSNQEQIVNHGGIPGNGGTILVSRPYFIGPCDIGSAGECNFFLHSFDAFVDSSNVVAESNENNNRSSVYDTCDGA